MRDWNKKNKVAVSEQRKARLIKQKAFRDWAVDNGWSNELTIERKNNSIGYFPNNCEFATRAVQARNRSTTKLDWGKVNKIREMIKQGVPQRVIAERFNIVQQHVSEICTNKQWVLHRGSEA